MQDCLVQIQRNKQWQDHADYSSPTRQHALDDTDDTHDQSINICPARSKSPIVPQWGLLICPMYRKVTAWTRLVDESVPRYVNSSAVAWLFCQRRLRTRTILKAETADGLDLFCTVMFSRCWIVSQCPKGGNTPRRQRCRLTALLPLDGQPSRNSSH